jgi:hypothetical protein
VVRSEPDERLVGVVIGAILLVQLAVLAIGAREGAGEQTTAGARVTGDERAARMTRERPRRFDALAIDPRHPEL